MLSVGKLFAIAAILALMIGFIRWPQPQTGFYTITIKNRAYGFGSDYWAFPIGAIFATLAAAYYWFPFVLSLNLGRFVSQLHFWLSAVSAFVFLFLAPAWQAFTPTRTAILGERSFFAVLLMAAISALLFLLAQVIFVAACVWSGFYGRNV